MIQGCRLSRSGWRHSETTGLHLNILELCWMVSNFLLKPFYLGFRGHSCFTSLCRLQSVAREDATPVPASYPCLCPFLVFAKPLLVTSSETSAAELWCTLSFWGTKEASAPRASDTIRQLCWECTKCLQKFRILRWKKLEINMMQDTTAPRIQKHHCARSP